MYINLSIVGYLQKYCGRIALLCLFNEGQNNKKCSSSQIAVLQNVHILFSLSIFCHRPVSIGSL